MINETRRCAAIKVSLAFCGVNEQPPTRLESSSTLEIVPLCATHKSLTFKGWAFSRSLFPTVEYLTCPIAACDAYSSVIFLNSLEDAETKPILFNGALLGIANPHASWPRCCNARNASRTIGITLPSPLLKIPTTPQFSLTII